MSVTDALALVVFVVTVLAWEALFWTWKDETKQSLYTGPDSGLNDSSDCEYYG